MEKDNNQIANVLKMQKSDFKYNNIDESKDDMLVNEE
jgi:hypothetical protein